jgi:hypothetical protein
VQILKRKLMKLLGQQIQREEELLQEIINTLAAA